MERFDARQSNLNFDRGNYKEVQMNIFKNTINNDIVGSKASIGGKSGTDT